MKALLHVLLLGAKQMEDMAAIHALLNETRSLFTWRGRGNLVMQPRPLTIWLQGDILGLSKEV